MSYKQKAIEAVWTWSEARRLHGPEYDALVDHVAQFAESLGGFVTVSKTTTQDLAWDEFQGCMSTPRSDLILTNRIAAFADSLTSELQKENARLREALENLCEILERKFPRHDLNIHDVDSELQSARAALSKEKAK